MQDVYRTLNNASIVQDVITTAIGLGEGLAGDWSRQPAGPDEAGLVGEHDELGAVSGAELGDRPADVGADGGRAGGELFGDLVVGEPSAHMRHDLTFAIGEDVEVAPGPGLLGSGGELGDQPSGH